jgi:predicted DNA binding protein
VIAECLVVEFAVTGDDCPLAAAARETGVPIDARPPQLRSDGNALLVFSTPAPDGVDAEDGDGATPDGESGSLDPTVLGDEERDRSADPARYGPVAEALDEDDRIRYLHASRSGDRINYRCLSKHPCVVHELTDAGFVAESLGYRASGERYTGAVVGYDVLEGVLSVGAERTGDGDTPGITVERIHPLGAAEDDPVAKRWSITPAQEEALRTALEMGYFSVPREADAGEVAAELGVGKSAFLERLRRGQAGLFAQVFGAG